MLYLYLNFPQLQLDTLYRTQQPNNETHQQVTIIVNGRLNEIVQLSQTAKDEGIQIGMGLGTALSLHPDIHLVEYQPNIERQRIEELAESLYQYIADISLFPPQGLCLQVHSMLTLYQGIAPLWQRIQQLLHDANLSYQFATGSNPLIAQYLAKSGFNQIITEQEPQLTAIKQLRVEQLSFSKNTTDSLNRVGVKTVKQLLDLPLKDLAKRFDLELVTTIGKLKGELQHKLTFFQPAEQFHSELELMYEITRSETLIHPIKHLLKKLEQFLQRRNLITQVLHFCLIQRDQASLRFDLASAQGQYKQAQWLKLLELRLESVQLTSPVIAIQLHCEKLHGLQPDTKDMFSKTSAAMEEAELYSLLQAKLGTDKLFQLHQTPDHHPLLANQLQPIRPLVDPPIRRLNQEQLEKTKLRPSYLLARPQRLKQHVELLHGPERLVNHWWDEHQICRDYFIGRTDKGQLCWLFRQPDKSWYIQGYFG